jgi:hypothetical protein
MRTHLKFLATATLMISTFSGTANGQGNATATVSGRVLDPQQLALPGVTVTARSPQLQGERTVVTSEGGDYILPLLPAGEYELTFELSSFAPRKERVYVGPGESKTLHVALSVSAVSETLTVTGARSNVSESAPATTNITGTLLEKLPTSRTILGAVAFAPGAHSTGPDGATTFSGAYSYQNLFLIDGVVAQDNLRSNLYNLYIEEAVQDTNIMTGAVSAEFGRFGGGVVNTITKSGGDRFSGSLRTTLTNDKWTALTPFPNDSRIDNLVPTIEATVGGPLQRGRMWFFAAARHTDPKVTRQTASFTNIPFIDRRLERRFQGKLTYGLTANHTFRGDYMRIQREEEGNAFPSPQTILDLASLVDRKTPQDMVSLHYAGILSPKFFVEGQFSQRHFSFQNSGARSTDLIEGALIIDQARGNLRYHAPTFCGVCGDEKRDNNNVLVKATYFMDAGPGAHSIVTGFDSFDDRRFANNHQSGADYRIFGLTSVIRGTEIYPVFSGSDETTFIVWNPILQETQGTSFRTHSVFVNDLWRPTDRVQVNLGLRFDKNDGSDSLGRKVVRDSALSPRVSATWDPFGGGRWSVFAGYGRYVTAIANSIADSQSPGGQPATFVWEYRGPSVNVNQNASTLVGQNDALRTLFDWFFANGGTARTPDDPPSVPGLTGVIAERLASPSAREITLGLSRSLAQRGSIRVEGIFRKYQDFYSTRTDTTTGKVTDPFNRVFDLGLIENTDRVRSDYRALNVQGQVLLGRRLTVGGNYTLSRAFGNFDGETSASGPITATVDSYPEYREPRWNSPDGRLGLDQRHRGRVWFVYDVPLPSPIGSLDVGFVQLGASGTPYGAAGQISPAAFVTNPGYSNQPAQVLYFFTPRDQFQTDSAWQSDLSLNYRRRVSRAELFARLMLTNLFNADAIDFISAINTATATRATRPTLQAFNPFTTQPVQGVHWDYGPQFGRPTSRLAYQTPRTFSMSVGVRF